MKNPIIKIRLCKVAKRKEFMSQWPCSCRDYIFMTLTVREPRISRSVPACTYTITSHQWLLTVETVKRLQGLARVHLAIWQMRHLLLTCLVLYII